MKKVVIISSSMRQGNSDKLASEFESGAKESGRLVTRINIRDINLKFCTGCRDCYNYGDCTIMDDMNGLYQTLREADVLVFSTPIYFGNMSGQLKTFIDRMYPLYTSIAGKKAYIIVSCYSGDYGFAEESALSLKRSLADFKICDVTMLYGVGLDEPNDVTASQLKEAFDAGRGV